MAQSGTQKGVWRASVAFGLFGLAILLAFWPTTFGPFGPPDMLRSVHGALALLWVVLLVVQAVLIERGSAASRTLHRRLGRLSPLLFVPLIGTAVAVVIDSLPAGGMAHFERPLLLTLSWIDLWSALLMSAFYALALVHRRDRFLHSRWMAATLIPPISPAFGRLLGMNIPALGGLEGALHPSFWVAHAVVGTALLLDLRGGRARSPWRVVFAAMLAIELTMFPAASWEWFISLLEGLGLPQA